MITTINKKDRLYICHCDGGFTCLGFDVCERKIKALGDELKRLGWALPAPAKVGTVERYEQLAKMENDARLYNERSGYRFGCELCPQLIGLERCRVEVVDCYGERRRFWVGKSTGWIPCHLEILKRTSSGGGAVTGAPFKSVKVITREGRR